MLPPLPPLSPVYGPLRCKLLDIIYPSTVKVWAMFIRNIPPPAIYRPRSEYLCYVNITSVSYFCSRKWPFFFKV